MRNYSEDIARLDRRLKPLENIQGGQGISVHKSPGGLVVSARNSKTPPAAKATAVADDDSGIVLEMHPEWSSTQQYRLNERVVYKGESDTYYLVYECADITAGAGDVPASSAKWNAITTAAAEWNESTTYGEGAVVMWGTAWQFALYTSIAGGNVGNTPSDATKWTKGADVMLGIKQWPPATGVYVPFREYVVADVRYSTADYKFRLAYAAHRFDKSGNLRAVTFGDYIVWAEAEACA
jgi:hypothetical protein